MTHHPMRRHLLWLTGAPLQLGSAGCSTRAGLQGADPSLVAALAPSGRRSHSLPCRERRRGGRRQAALQADA